MRGESITVDINDINIASALGNTFFEDPCSLVDQRVDHPGDDLLVAKGTGLDCKAPRLGTNQSLHFRIRQALASFRIIAVITCAGFLAQATHFNQLIGDVGCRMVRAVR